MTIKYNNKNMTIKIATNNKIKLPNKEKHSPDSTAKYKPRKEYFSAPGYFLPKFSITNGASRGYSLRFTYCVLVGEIGREEWREECRYEKSGDTRRVEIRGEWRYEESGDTGRVEIREWRKETRGRRGEKERRKRGERERESRKK
jgi:hypothetical protein